MPPVGEGACVRGRRGHGCQDTPVEGATHWECGPRGRGAGGAGPGCGAEDMDGEGAMLRMATEGVRCRGHCRRQGRGAEDTDTGLRKRIPYFLKIVTSTIRNLKINVIFAPREVNHFKF
jgi:hypothetical protein